MSYPPKILYVCERCWEDNPEGCGYGQVGEICVMPNGSWLCDGCAMDLSPGDLADYGVKDGEEPTYPHPEPYEKEEAA